MKELKKQKGFDGIIGGCLKRSQRLLWITALWWLTVAIIIVALVAALPTHRLSGLEVALHALVLAMLLRASLPTMTFRTVLTQRYAKTTSQFFLAGEPVYDFFDTDAFWRMKFYLGHGLCYEAAALAMLMSQSNNTSRLVIAEATGSTDKVRVQHAYVELKAFGYWWVIDPTWQSRFITLKWQHRLSTHPHELRVISHDEFWAMPLAKQLHTQMQHRETSQVFLDLAGFRCTRAGSTTLLAEQPEAWRFGQTDGRQLNLTLMDIYGDKHLITSQIVRQYLAKPARLQPKRRAIRQAQAMLRTIHRANADAIKLRMRLDITTQVTIHFISLKEYWLEVCDENAG